MLENINTTETLPQNTISRKTEMVRQCVVFMRRRGWNCYKLGEDMPDQYAVGRLVMTSDQLIERAAHIKDRMDANRKATS